MANTQPRPRPAQGDDAGGVDTEPDNNEVEVNQ